MRKINAVLIATSLLALFACQNISGQSAQPKGPKGKPVAEWKKQLTPDEYYIMVEKGTEPPFHNAYYNNHQKGVYVSAATGEVLFSSDSKFDSGTGWPSFTKPVDKSKVLLVRDADGERTEVVEKSTGLHLGHVFDDGPADQGGKRYCMNSGALKFIKK
ncbi:peptide-methionine (R)-S-oxide reductase MsrB [Mucilaginibacter robiniae]|uniref:peptide-methionine (R)-S-oxide reductase n=1 Tax=Mucilaginibacter robiniae TaxID=2728022 RepID=A0A7L5E6X6_9SPHI|nr:peptide-methionine (R)-S-oxide reductase MsrB [Mucilaginibacter robiniae]QJD98147.1 peptide-methionine (R)-S-oxide reductase MsrB [Mucilaginibacter robiniae]